MSSVLEGIYHAGASLIDYNNVWSNGSANDGGPNGISTNPLFTSAIGHDYTLQFASPCIDAGDPSLQYDDPDGTRNDMGGLYFDQGSNLPLAEDRNLGTEVLDHVLSHTPTVYWSFADTATGVNQSALEVQVGTDNDWSVAEMWSTGTISSPDTFLVYAGLPLQDGAEYTLRVRLNNGTTWGDWRFLHFTMNLQPFAFSAVSPVGGATIPAVHAQLTINNALDTESDTLTYDFEIFGDSALVTLVDSDYAVAEQDSVTQSKVFTSLMENSQYWWRARAFDGYEYSDWSVEESFVARPRGVIHVPVDLSSIQVALAAAWNGDTVEVAPGTYFENIDFLGKAIVLHSSGGRDVTVIQSAIGGVPVVTFAGGEDSLSVIDGFAIRGAAGVSGLVCNASHPIIRHCDIGPNAGPPEWGGGILCLLGAAPKIRYNVIRYNQATYGGAIAARVSTAPEIAYNIIHSNSGARPGIAVEGGMCKIHRNIVRNNLGGEALYGAGIWFQGNGHEIINNTVVGNTIGLSTNNGVSTILNNIVVSNAQEGIHHAGSSLIDYNDVWNNGSANEPGIHGISIDPLFTDAVSHDYSLQVTSPCIDAGDPSSPLDPDSSRADMGALPGSQIEFIRGDANYDETVNASDIIYLVNYVFKGGAAPQPLWQAGDTNCDWKVNTTDVIYLVNYIFKSGPGPPAQCF